MFDNCINLTEIEFNYNTSTKNLEDMSYMFCFCTSLEKINMKIFKENKLINLDFVFGGCESLNEIDLSYFESKYITELKGTFYNCKSLEKINLTYFDFSEVKIINNILIIYSIIVLN